MSTNWPLNINMTNTQLNSFLCPPSAPLFSSAFLSLIRLLKFAGLKDQSTMISRFISLYQEQYNNIQQQKFPKIEKMDTDTEEPFYESSPLATMYTPPSTISSPPSVAHSDEDEPLDLRCAAKMAAEPVKLGNWEREQINILVEIHLIVQQMRATKVKLKSLSKEKKMILREKQRIEHRREQQQRDKPTCSYVRSSSTTTVEPKASSASPISTVAASIDAVLSTRKPTSLWRPIEFSQPTSPPPSLAALPSPVPVALVNAQHTTIIQKQKKSLSKSPMAFTPSSRHHKQRLLSNQSFINEPKRKGSTAPSALSPSTSSSSSLSSSYTLPDIKQLPCDESDMVTIGPNGTKIPKVALQNINWSLKETYVIRKLLMEVFDRDTLAFHNLSGKPSPAFVGCNKPLKGQLDPLKVADFVHIITKHLNITEKEVRQTITIKCADENKRVRNELMKMLAEGQNTRPRLQIN